MDSTTSEPSGGSSPEASLALWHRMVAARDLRDLTTITHPDVVFRSPVTFRSHSGADALGLVLGAAMQVFGDFAYHRELVTREGTSVALEFIATVGDKQVKGIDLIRFDPAGLITEFEVLVRPLSGLQALAVAMNSKVGEALAARGRQ